MYVPRLSLIARGSLAACAGAALLGVGTALAMSVTPIFLDLEEGVRTAGTISVSNPTEGRLPVEISISQMTLGADGKVGKLTPAGDDFVTIPAQALIAPGATQNFRIQYVRAEPLKESRLYQFSIDQMPVTPSGGVTSQIQIVYSMSGFIVVAPLESRSAVAVTGTGISTDAKGVSHPVVTLTNGGARHALLSRGSLSLRQLDESGAVKWRLTLPPERIDKEVGLGIVPGNGTRTFTLPYDLPSAGGKIEAEYDNGRQK